jgi:hypothetical protein
MSLGRIFKFGKPKNPGYGISKSFYYSVLAGHAQLPSPDEVANPQGAREAVEGFLAPLMPGSAKEDLQKPLVRGTYALASKDRKTVLRLMVVSKEEAGFDTEALAKSVFALQVSPEALARVRATWTLLQLTFESHDAMVGPSLDFLHRVARRLAELTEGVVADPVSQRYMLPQDVPEVHPAEPIQAADHISVQIGDRDGKRMAYTLGMQKFGLNEFELQEFSQVQSEAVAAFLVSVAQANLTGPRIELGDQLGSKKAPFDVVPGGIAGGFLEGVRALELIPSRGNTAEECLEAWMAEVKR